MVGKSPKSKVKEIDISKLTRTTPGHKVGALKVAVDTFMPEPGKWEEQHVIHDFGNGWKIILNVTEYDRRLMAMLTKTCVASLVPRCLPAPEFNMEEWEQKERKKWVKYYDTEPNRKWWAKQGKDPDKELERLVSQNVKNAKAEGVNSRKPIFKLLHLQDYKKRPRACILAVLESSLKNTNERRHIGYAYSRDLGQKHPIEIDGDMCHILEVRIGTGSASPAVAEEYMKAWYEAATGKWVEDDYVQQLAKRQYYGGFEYTPARVKELERFRKAA